MTTSTRRVTILGSTGSIGTQAIDVIRAQNAREGLTFEVAGLAAGGSDPGLLARQAVELGVPTVAVARDDEQTRAAVDAALRQAIAERASAGAAGAAAPPEVLWGPTAATELAARPVDTVLNGITGSIGLAPTLAALQAGSTLALANKESLIVGGPIVRGEVQREGQIVPVDSEHSALAQCLRAGRAQEVRRLVLTASGGPFRGRTREELREVTPAQALAHPTWDMGRVVTTNSATLVNKGLEVIEAHLLFDIGFERITVVVHPTSDVHSMVEFHDGSTLLQASPPTMLIPIALGLAWPSRLVDVAPAYDWSRPRTFEFAPLDDEAFPAVRLAREVGSAGGTFPAVYNAANEECVEAFHEGRIGFLDIVDTVERVVADHDAGVDGAAEIAVRGNEVGALTVDQVLAAETWARRRAHQVLGLV